MVKEDVKFEYSIKRLQSDGFGAYKSPASLAIEIKNKEKNKISAYIPVDDIAPVDVAKILFRDGNTEILKHLPYSIKNSATFLNEVLRYAKGLTESNAVLFDKPKIADGILSVFDCASNMKIIAEFLAKRDNKKIEECFKEVLASSIEIEKQNKAAYEQGAKNYIDKPSSARTPEFYKENNVEIK